MIASVLFLVMALGQFAMESLAEEAEQPEGKIRTMDPAVLTAELGNAGGWSIEPWCGENQEKVVFGKDDRLRVSNPTEYPFICIAYMNVTGECGDAWTGTGFLIGKDLLMTAAHCLVCPKHGKWADDIDFYFGYKNKRNYYLKYSQGWHAFVGNTFEDGEYSFRGDYGLVRLNKEIGNITGWLGISGKKDEELDGSFCYTAGFQDGMLQYDSGTVSVWDDELIYYQIDTTPGSSGGPVFTSDNYAIAVNVAENGIWNYGFRMTDEVFQTIENMEQ